MHPDKPIALYPTTVHQAYRMDETGGAYALFPWTGDTDRYAGESGEPDRAFVLAKHVELVVGDEGDLIAIRPCQYSTEAGCHERPLFPAGAVATPVAELIGARGTILDGAFGSTRPVVPGEPLVTAADLGASF